MRQQWASTTNAFVLASPTPAHAHICLSDSDATIPGLCLRRCPFFVADYFNAQKDLRPRLFAMTASPAGEDTVEKTRALMQTLCENLHAMVTTPQEHDSELQRHVSRPNLEFLPVIDCEEGSRSAEHLMVAHFCEYLGQVADLCCRLCGRPDSLRTAAARLQQDAAGDVDTAIEELCAVAEEVVDQREAGNTALRHLLVCGRSFQDYYESHGNVWEPILACPTLQHPDLRLAIDHDPRSDAVCSRLVRHACCFSSVTPAAPLQLLQSRSVDADYCR